MTETLTHRCLRGRQCADHESTPDGGRLGAATEAPDSLCPACERRAQRAIRELPRLYAELETIIGQHASVGEHVSGTRELPTPPRLDVLTLQGDIDWAVSTWAAPVAARCRIPWDESAMRRSRPGPRIERGAHILASNLDALLRLNAHEVPVWVPGYSERTGKRVPVKHNGTECALTILTLAQRGRHLVTGGSGDSRLPVPCPHCEARSLVRANGGEQVDCMSCGSYWPEAHYRRLCLVLADAFRPELRKRRRRAA
jgi:hypothetical protein